MKVSILAYCIIMFQSMSPTLPISIGVVLQEGGCIIYTTLVEGVAYTISEAV